MQRRFAREDKVKEYVTGKALTPSHGLAGCPILRVGKHGSHWRKYATGANILLAHFHYCNKGTHPFSDDCKDQDLRTLGDLDDEQIQFVHATKSYAKRHSKSCPTPVPALPNRSAAALGSADSGPHPRGTPTLMQYDWVRCRTTLETTQGARYI
jgi:hypothetical protein